MTQDPESVKEAKQRWYKKLCYKKLRFRRNQARGLIAVVPVAAVILYLGFQSGKVNSKSIESVPQMEEITKVHDRNGKVIFEFYQKKRIVVPLSRVSKDFLQALVATEDRNFYRHSGFDFLAILRAAAANVRAGRVVQGASTMTQQLARNTFLTSERSLTRKIQELLLAWKIERSYTKNQILEYYVNRVYFGSGFYGIEAASQGYFGKPAAELKLDEAALLAGLAKAPASYSPYKNPQRALERRNRALDALTKCDVVSEQEAEAAKRQPLRVRPYISDSRNSSYAVDYIRERLLEMFGYERTFNGGLNVYTTLDSEIQADAESAVEDQLVKIEKQPGFKGVSRAQFLKDHRWEPESAAQGEVRPSYLQGALLCMNARTGEIYAMVGGRNHRESEFNRAVHASRQPGSAFKPFVYATALKLGMSPSSKVEAGSLEFMTSEGVYQPANVDGALYGSVSLRTALRKSINTAAVQLGQEIGLQNIVRGAHEFGISGELRPVASLPLGAVEVTLMEMVRAYSAFPNGGKVSKPSIISRVEDKQGRTLYAAEPAYDRVLDERIAFLMTTMLADAVDRGTGSGVRAAGYHGPMGGKTGTTDDYRDAWFIGFTPDVVTGVWIGFDAPKEILNRGYGASLAVPIWARFMKQRFSNSHAREFSMPAGVIRIALCVESGQAVTSSCHSRTMTPDGQFFNDIPSTYWEYFLESNPPRTCVVHQPY
jgi:1A family penicillin-binding protein